MSIKAFSVQPCATCAVDTTHYACKCRECGTVQPNPYEQRRASNARLFATGAGQGLMRKARGIHAAEQRRERDAVPLGALMRRVR